MAEKKSTRSGTRRRAQNVEKKPSAAPAAFTPADAVRTLREAVEARASGRKRERDRLVSALTGLEAEHRRVTTMSRRPIPRGTAAVTRRAKGRGARLDDAEPSATDVQPVPDVEYLPTPPELVDIMLDAAGISAADVVYDLGSGDGRIVIAAARRWGARGVGIDISEERVREATARAVEAGVADHVSFIQSDLFEADIRPATVVTLYLLPALNMRLRRALLDQLRPGTRIVSHQFDMGDWEPAETRDVDGRQIYLWIVPEGTTPA